MRVSPNIFDAPSVHPFEERDALAGELDGQPNVAGIARAAGRPAVGHKEEGIALAVDGKNKCALRIEGAVGQRTEAGIAVGGPFAKEVGGRIKARRVRIPARASRGDEPVAAAVLEKGRGFVVAAREDAGVFARVGEEIGGKAGDVEREVVLRRIDVISHAVVVDKERHVARHLSALEIAFYEKSAFDGATPARCPPFFVVVRAQRVEDCGVKADGQASGVGAERMEVGVRPFGAVADGHCGARGGVALAFEFEVKPHDELPRAGIVNHLRTFHCATLFEVVTRGFDHGQHHAAVGPRGEIGRGVARYAHESRGGVVAFVLAKPIVNSLVVKDAPAVGVDVLPVGVEPEFARTNLSVGKLGKEGKDCAEGEED